MGILRSTLPPLAVALFALLVRPGAAAELKVMSAGEIRALQQRLSDAKCYAGPIDGIASPATEAALKRCPVMDPVLRIETATHTASLRRVGADFECRLLATGSYDKTVRLWSLPEGQFLKALRLPIGPGHDGRVDAVAVSPDGTLVAAGGWDARWSGTQKHGIYLFDAATGALRARVGAFDNVIQHLAFSPDGRRLAATLGAGYGLRVVDVGRQAEIAADRGYGSDSYGAAFAPDGRLYTVAYDGQLRQYDQNFRLVKKAPTHGGKQPYGIAVDPSGERLAVGFLDSTAVDVYRTSDLGFAFAADTAGIDNGALVAVSWSTDGRRLIAGGRYLSRGSDGQWRTQLLSWDAGGRGPRRAQAVANDTIMHLLPCGSGLVVGASDPVLALLDADGSPRLARSGAIADMRGQGDAFRVGRDGRRVRLGLQLFGARPVLFDLERATLGEGGSDPGLSAPRASGLPVTDWKDAAAPKLAGTPLKLEPYETSRSLAISPDRTGFVLGADWSLRAFDAQGRERWKKQAPGAAWGVNVTGDGRLVLAAYGDGTVRWYRIGDGQELLALFVHAQDKRWVAWTPAGYYMASPGGEDLIGWHLNRGWDQAPDFFPASRFRERFNRPDIVQKVLDTLDEAAAVREANQAARLRPDTASVQERLPPVVRILSPRDGTELRHNEVTIEYELRSPSGLPVDGVEVLLDGRPTRGLARIDAAPGGARVARQVVTLPSRDVELGLVARSGTLASDVAKIRLKWAGQVERAAGPDLLKPKLYGVVVGVSTYQDGALNLRFAAKDARDFAAALQAQKGGIYRDVELQLLTDAQATATAIKRAMTWLERNATSRDVAVLFLAGHGVNDEKNRYFYLAADSDRSELLDTAVDGTTFRERMRSIAGKALVFLDTCHAGQVTSSGTRGVVDINAVVNELSSTENGVVTYASSTGREVSQENEAWGNGAFTKAVLEGLGLSGGVPKADLNRNGAITTAELDAWVAERVKELTRGSQHPVMSRPSTVPDFPIFTAGR